MIGKKVKSSAAAVAASLFACAMLVPVTACGHTHVWGDWQRSGTEHWRVCTVQGCTEEQRAVHSGEPCSVCGYGFRVLAFGFDENGDPAHADFAKEAEVWFAERGNELGFSFDFVNTDYTKLNDENLANYDVVMFLNDRPHDEGPKAALEKFMKEGGAFMGFHACAFSMEGNNEHWTWYQDEFLGCGDYLKNTWNPTSEPLRVETYDHCATKNLDLEGAKQEIAEDPFWDGLVLDNNSFLSAPCEWYGWMSDLFDNDDITVLLTLNPTQTSPAGDDSRKGYEFQIWTEGRYPIAWANNNYNMIYMNWGHNLQSYNEGEEGTSSSTFSRKAQNQFMLDGLYGIALQSVQSRR